jgi:hypothetical protein
MDDLEAPGAMLRRVAGLATAARDIVLLFTGGDVASLDMCANALLQMRDVGLEQHALVVTERAQHCAALARRPARAACGWSSRILEWAPADSVSMRKFWDARFRFYPVKKRWLAELVRAGYGVLQADTDTAWKRNPLPALRTINASIIVQADNPIANAGLIYARPGGARAQAMLDRLAWTISLMQSRPSVVGALVPFARPPYYANSDDQTGLNDAIVVAVTNNQSFALLGSIFRFEARSVHHASNVSWTSRPEFITWKNGLRQTLAKRRTLHMRDGGKWFKCDGFPLGENDHLAVAPPNLFAHAEGGWYGLDNAITHLSGHRDFEAKRSALRDAGRWLLTQSSPIPAELDRGEGSHRLSRGGGRREEGGRVQKLQTARQQMVSRAEKGAEKRAARAAQVAAAPHAPAAAERVYLARPPTHSIPPSLLTLSR